MVNVAALYNTLPPLGEANARFVNREAVLRAVAALLAQHDHTFGLCLVHAHCQLAENEIMLASRSVSEPTMTKHVPTHNPERWLSSGVPYEFNVRKTKEPPAELIAEFQRIVQEANLQDILGLYHINRNRTAPVYIEWTEGRKKFTRRIEDHDMATGPFQTRWDFSRGDPVTMGCAIFSHAS